MKKQLFAFVLMCPPALAGTEIYKCTVNGKTNYTDQPCDGGQKMEIHDTGSSGSGMVDAGMVNVADDLERDRLRSKINRNIQEREERIGALRVQMEREISAIQRTKARANNNLAGATWEQSLSTQQEAITKQYDIQIQAEQRAIDRLLEERGRL